MKDRLSNLPVIEQAVLSTSPETKTFDFSLVLVAVNTHRNHVQGLLKFFTVSVLYIK
jgi:hypothetical protein